jgi:hypothetical protein
VTNLGWWRRCHNGHDPVSWKDGGPCWYCGHDGYPGHVFDAEPRTTNPKENTP